MRPPVDSPRRLRTWALLQFLYDCLPTRFTALEDLVGSFRDHISVTFVTGHLNRSHFVCLQDDFPSLKKPGAYFVNHTLLQIGIDNLKALASKKASETGVLSRYAAAELAHLLACKRCQQFVQEAIREDIKLTSFLRSVTGRNGTHSRPK